MEPAEYFGRLILSFAQVEIVAYKLYSGLFQTETVPVTESPDFGPVL